LKISIGADHAGYDLKEVVRGELARLGQDVSDAGTGSPQPSVDYPDYATKVARAVAKGECDRGILICGSGIGMAITANKVPGVRAALCHDHYTALVARLHNDANLLCMGGRTTGTEVAKEIVRTFLETSFEGGRHERRVEKIRNLEDGTR
jgi:ribose 5-phosphate isomerase B